ncbi:MAG: hypothetical protein COA45_07705 [Zetaproteobacteria bacterium]|nr:MAG: hypothetical protein COA45_07705 [Zetaproteobacteria bacterium]
MSDNKKPHEPILKPLDEAKFKMVQRKAPGNPEDHVPVLLSDDGRSHNVKPPYLLLFIVILGVFMACWKIWMYGGVEEIDKKHDQAHAILQEKAAKIRH